MKESAAIEYFCTDCNSIINKDDKICPNCGADLIEEITNAKFTKTKHRVIFYILFIPFVLVFTILLTDLIETLLNSKDFYLYSLNVSLAIMFLLITTASIVFDLRAVGYIFLVITAWGMCGLLGVPAFGLHPEQLIEFNTRSMLINMGTKIIVCFTLGRIFLVLSQFIEYRSHKNKHVTYHLKK